MSSPACLMVVLLALRSVSFSKGKVLRVGCLQGKPPFVDVVDGACVGIMADAFFDLMKNTTLQYSMHFIKPSTLAALAKSRPICDSGTFSPSDCVVNPSDIPSVLFHTPQNSFDIGITFSFVDPDRHTYVDPSIPLIDSYYSALLSPSYAPGFCITAQIVLHLALSLLLLTAAIPTFILVIETVLFEPAPLLFRRAHPALSPTDSDVEAGARLNGALLRTGRVDELLAYLAPTLLGEGRGMAALGPLESLGQGLAFDFHEVVKVGTDLRILARTRRP